MSEQDLYRDTNGKVYIELFNELHHIADFNTLSAIFGSNPDITDDMPNYNIGFPIQKGSFLLLANNAIYLMTNGCKYLITSPAVLTHYQFVGNQYGGDALANLMAPFVIDGENITI